MNDRPEPLEPPDSFAEDTALADALVAWLDGDPSQIDALRVDDRAAARDLQLWLALLAADHQPDQHGGSEMSVGFEGSGDPGDPPADDPIAIALGLVVDPDRRLDSAGLTRARRAAGLKASQLAMRLSARGWDIAARDIAAWERAGPSLAPALVSALAEVLQVHTDTLMPPRRGGEPPWLVEALSDERIAHELEAWAQDEATSTGQVRRYVVDSLAGAGFRERRTPTVEALLAVIAVLRQSRPSRPEQAP